MPRTIYLVRHATSEGTRHNQASFGPKGGALTETGVQEAKAIRNQFVKLGINVETEPVATSQAKRTFDTARYAGFQHISKYTSLNEAGNGLTPEVLDDMLKNTQAPPAAVAAAQKLLKHPPKEIIWITHGQVIAGIARVLGIPSSELFIPKMGTITKLELP
ncbi:MAG: histidine phosphatase family protein [Candidatus Saccharimonadales bacterium]